MVHLVKKIIGRPWTETAITASTVPTLKVLDKEEIGRRILHEVEAALGQRRVLREPVRKYVRGVVACEVAFVGKQRRSFVTEHFFRSCEARVAEFVDWQETVLRLLLDQVPHQSETRGGMTYKVALVTLLPDPQDVLTTVVRGITTRHCDGETLHLGAASAEAVVANMVRISGFSEDDVRKKPSRLVWPRDVAKPAVDLAAAFLADTDLVDLLLSSVSVNIAKRLVAS